MDRITRQEMLASIVMTMAKRSKCLRSQVGALIEKEGRVISTGYNGPVAGAPCCTPIPTKRMGYGDIEGNIHYEDREVLADYVSTTCEGAGCTRSVHAEANAIIFAARNGVAVKDCVMYCTLSPCMRCAQMIINAGISEVVYLEEYRDVTPITFLMERGVEVSRLGDEVEEPSLLDQKCNYLVTQTDSYTSGYQRVTGFCTALGDFVTTCEGCKDHE